jgi:prepilin-type N-terminal cleavage/methylation domain-containing protein
MNPNQLPPPSINIKQNGFTLVEISIVMIIIGVLIGGVFGGMKLIENMQVNSTVQMINSIESVAITFKDTYGRLPGDITNPSTRLPNCAVAPCATGGNGDRRLDILLAPNAAITNANERFTFWHHLQAANLTNLGIKNTTDMTFGEGSPETSLGIGLRMGFAGISPSSHNAYFTNTPSNIIAYAPEDLMLNGQILQAIEGKMDDGKPQMGRIWTYSNCYTGAWGATAEYVYTGSSCGGLIAFRF